MQIDWSAFFAGAALVLAVASPIFTALIETKSAQKIRKEEFYTKHRAETMEKYASAACRMLYWDDKDTRAEYSKYFGEILLIVPAELKEKLIQFDRITSQEIIPDDENELRQELFYEICDDLAQQTPRVKKHK